MSRENIKEQLIALCVDIFSNDSLNEELINFMDFANDLGMDSITFISLIVEIEAMFSITVPDDLLLMDNFRNIDDVVRIIEQRLSEKMKENEDECDDKT